MKGHGYDWPYRQKEHGNGDDGVLSPTKVLIDPCTKLILRLHVV